ncbi:MAG: hypothetical protein IJ262_01790 [Clostridia bacterium]|nr:hypothetical protein [Clostridia bacterium]
MKFGGLEEVVYAVLIFTDKVIGWLSFVLGGADSPDTFTNGLWELLGMTKDENPSEEG